MTSDEAADAWLRFLLRTGPRVDGVVLRVIAERLANTTEPDELLALAGWSWGSRPTAPRRSPRSKCAPMRIAPSRCASMKSAPSTSTARCCPLAEECSQLKGDLVSHRVGKAARHRLVHHIRFEILRV